ncbi:N/A [soil metagenome]
MTLRVRFSLAAALLAVLVAVGFGTSAFFAFARQIDSQLETVLRSDLERVATLLDRPSLGASFRPSGNLDVILQFVTANGDVVLSWGAETLLPPDDGPILHSRDGRTYLVATAPWQSTAGTIRLAHDVSGAMQARRELAGVLAVSGIVVVLVASFAALLGVQGILRPLALLARQTRDMGPSLPTAVDYDGPADEVGDVADGLNTAFAAIRQRHDEERAFLLEVAHELAAPLTLVHYHLDGLRRERPDDVTLRAAADAARELLRTSQDLLVVARGELESDVTYEVLELRDLVRRVANEYPGVEVDTPTAGDVVGDPERLVQVIRNVVRNGVQACGSTNGVRIDLVPEGSDQVLRVSDSGSGMSDEVRERAFERGYTRGAGVGVGLSVAQSLVERHGGRILVASTSPGGTTIEVRIPSLHARVEGAPTVSVP